jgi:hypothetical protein
MKLMDYPQSAAYVEKCKGSLEACAKLLGFDLKKKTFKICGGYFSDSIDDYATEMIESAFTSALMQQVNIEMCLERDDIDAFAVSLGHLSATTAFLSSVVRKKGEHEGFLKFEAVRSGHQNTKQAKDKRRFQKWAREKNIRVENIQAILDDKTCPLDITKTYDWPTVRDWYREVYPDQLRGGRPQKT